jgi:hypothetical protein
MHEAHVLEERFDPQNVFCDDFDVVPRPDGENVG